MRRVQVVQAAVPPRPREELIEGLEEGLFAGRRLEGLEERWPKEQ